MKPSQTPSQELDAKLARLDAGRERWRALRPTGRDLYLQTMQAALVRVAPRWVEFSCKAKGLACGLWGEGEEWMLGPLGVARFLASLRWALSARYRPRLGPPKRRIDGRSVVPVFPLGALETTLWLGMRADTWLRGPVSQGREFAAALKQPGRCCLILGAGNVSSIPVTDALSKLFLENQTVLLKMSPVNEYLTPLLRELFYPLIREGFLDIVTGGKEVVQEALADERVHTVHLTGSDATRRAIEAQTDKPLTTELGCVSPVIVVPGPYTRRQLRYQARHLASMVAFNAGCNCVAAQVLITCKGWNQRHQFLEELKLAFDKLPQRPAYYPGSAERRDAFRSDYSESCRFGVWTLIPDLDAEAEQRVFQDEAFCGLLAEVAIEAEDPGDFLDRASDFANERLWGDLSATVLIHPNTRRYFERYLQGALNSLRYGTIGVNLWPGVGFGLMTPPWGAHPGPEAESGKGFVHNTVFLDRVEKTVLWAPFTMPFLPPWFVGHPRGAELGRRLTEFEYEPSLPGLLAVQSTIVKTTLSGHLP